MNFSRISNLSFTAAITALIVVGKVFGQQQQQQQQHPLNQRQRQAQEVPLDDEILYYDEPVQKWTAQLPFTGETSFGPKVGNGNAVSVSPDNSLIYTTLDNGRLEVLRSSDGTRFGGYLPTPIVPGWSTSCISGVAFGQKKDSTRFIIHTLIHTPSFPESLEEDVQSQLIAISHPSLRVMWTTTIPGAVQGNAIVTSGNRYAGEYVVFTHNQNVTSSTLTGGGVGSFSIILVETGELIFTEIAGESRFDPTNETLVRLDTLRHPYGPLGTAPTPVQGRYPGGLGNPQDLFIWSTSILNGQGDNGYTRVFQFPRIFQPEFVDMLATTFLKENRWNAKASPTLSQDGLKLLFGVRANSVRGWTSTQDFDKGGNIVESLDSDPSVGRIAIPYSPVLSPSESTFFVSTSYGTLYSLSTLDGEIIWDIDAESPISASVKVSKDGEFLYYTTESGTVAALEQDSGDEVWEINCENIDNDENSTACADIIEAESSLSPNGLVLYYSDVFGNVKALQLGELGFPTPEPSEFPTSFPTQFPSTSSPSENPSLVPSISPTSSLFPTIQPSLSPSETPSETPSSQPSEQPSEAPSEQPSEQPSKAPSEQPSESPSEQPSEAPSEAPSGQPSPSPSTIPSQSPSYTPSLSPTMVTTVSAAPSQSATTPTPTSIDSGASHRPWSSIIFLLSTIVGSVVF